MILIFTIIAILIFLLGLIMLWFIRDQNKKFGVLTGNRIYTDTETKPGGILYSKSVNLSGKPDYLIRENDMVFPVEVKSGKTPDMPYLNHTTQLMAYCLLVEENFGVRPVGGYLKYPNREFKIAYTDEARESIKKLVQEMWELKRNGQEFQCGHREHNLI